MNDNSVLFALDANTGAIKWKTRLDGVYSPSSPAVASDGTIWVGDMTTIYSIKGISGLDPNAAWPMYHHDSAHTGRQNAGSCPAVQGLTVAPDYAAMRLFWNPVSGATYTVKRAPGGSSVFTTLATGLTSPTYTDGDPTLQTFSTYCYVVETQCGAASASAPVQATTVPIVVNVQFTDPSLGGEQKLGTAAARVGSFSDFWNDFSPNQYTVIFGDPYVEALIPSDRNGQGPIFLGASTANAVSTTLTKGDGDLSAVSFGLTALGSGNEPLFQNFAGETTGLYLSVGPLPPGSYDLFLYGIRQTSTARVASNFRVLTYATMDSEGSWTYAYNGTLGYTGIGVSEGGDAFTITDHSKSTSMDPNWDINQFVEGNQYVKFKYLQVGPTGYITVAIFWGGGGSFDDFGINGFQILSSGQECN
jgi:hypothetical protein